MSLSTKLEQLEPIAAVVVAEHTLIRAMRADGETPEPQVEAATFAAAIAQLALLRPVLICEAIQLEQAAALAEA